MFQVPVGIPSRVVRKNNSPKQPDKRPCLSTKNDQGKVDILIFLIYSSLSSLDFSFCKTI